MPPEKINPYWYDLNQIVRVLVQELDKSAGPDWSNIFNQAQDLMALSQAAMKQSGGKSPPS